MQSELYLSTYKGITIPSLKQSKNSKTKPPENLTFQTSKL